jgi:hypothetical protein
VGGLEGAFPLAYLAHL